MGRRAACTALAALATGERRFQVGSDSELEEGERLSGKGSINAGELASWLLGETFGPPSTIFPI